MLGKARGRGRVARPPLLDDLTELEHGEAIRHREREREVLFDDQDGAAELISCRGERPPPILAIRWWAEGPR